MKSFYVSLAVFGLLFAVIIFNSLFVRQTADRLTSLLGALPPCEEASEPFEEATRFWEERRSLIALTAPHKDIEALNTQMLHLKAAIQTKDAHAFERARTLAIDAADYLQALEKFSIDNLL